MSDLGLGELALFEVPLEQRVVRLRDGLHQLLAEGVCLARDVVRPFALFACRHRAVPVGLPRQEVGDARELVLLADRNLERGDLRPE